MMYEACLDNLLTDQLRERERAREREVSTECSDGGEMQCGGYKD